MSDPFKSERKRKRSEARRARLEEAEYTPSEYRTSRRKGGENRSNREILSNAIAAAEATEKIGAQAAGQLETQTEQMEMMDNSLYDLGAILRRSENILTGMESWGGFFSKDIPAEIGTYIKAPGLAHLKRQN
jgi:hypothetical protein